MLSLHHGPLDESRTIVGLEALDDALVLWLDMHGKIWLEVFNLIVLKIGRNNVAGKVVLKEKYLLILGTKLTIPQLNPVLVELSSHPSLCIMLVVESQLGTSLFVEHAWSCCFPNDEGWEFLRTIHICCECICQSEIFAFDS